MDKYDEMAEKILVQMDYSGVALDHWRVLVAAFGRECAAQAFEEAAKQVPSNWLDPLLTGPKSIVGNVSCPDVERLYKAVSERLKRQALARSIRSPHADKPKPCEDKGECGKEILTPSSCWYCPRPKGHRHECGLKIMPEDERPSCAKPETKE